jgi:hypothetical protein
MPEQHGRVAAQNIYAIMRGGETKKKLQEYKPDKPGRKRSRRV